MRPGFSGRGSQLVSSLVAALAAEQSSADHSGSFLLFVHLGRDPSAQSGARSITRATAPGRLLAGTNYPIGKRLGGRTVGASVKPESVYCARAPERPLGEIAIASGMLASASRGASDQWSGRRVPTEKQGQFCTRSHAWQPGTAKRCEWVARQGRVVCADAAR